MGLLKKIKKPLLKEGAPLSSLWDALDQADDSTRAYAVYGIVEADKENKLEAPTLLTFLEIIYPMDDEIPIKDDLMEMISSKIMDMGDEALPCLSEIEKANPKCKVIIKKLIYYINSSKKIDEFEDIMKRMSR